MPAKPQYACNAAGYNSAAQQPRTSGSSAQPTSGEFSGAPDFVKQGGNQLRGRKGTGQGRSLPGPMCAVSRLIRSPASRVECFTEVVGNGVFGNVRCLDAETERS